MPSATVALKLVLVAESATAAICIAKVSYVLACTSFDGVHYRPVLHSLIFPVGKLRSTLLLSNAVLKDRLCQAAVPYCTPLMSFLH